MTGIADQAAVLFANEAFYRAFADRDVAAMAALWAESAPVLCIHPGWPPVHGRDAVLASWARILRHPQAPDIACVAPRAHVLGPVALVVCHEALQGQALVATNLFRREAGAWRLFHHQASPAPGLPTQDPPDPPLRPN
jgi:ketosteroid isomerase-like protein